MNLILASSSAIRLSMLRQSGIEPLIVAPSVDETMVKAGHSESDADLALALAEAKALDVSARQGGAWVIGGDSVISVAGRRFDKPADRVEATAHLRFFAGKIMTLTSAVALAIDTKVDWNFVGTAQLHVRDLSEEFIQSYLDVEWPDVAACVGVFRMEDRGVTLFDAVEGDHFTILGMPLIPLLGALRVRGILPS